MPCSPKQKLVVSRRTSVALVVALNQKGKERRRHGCPFSTVTRHRKEQTIWCRAFEFYQR